VRLDWLELTIFTLKAEASDRTLHSISVFCFPSFQFFSQVSAVSSIFLVATLILAVAIGPQLRPWTWGPAMLTLGIALAAAIPALWKKQKGITDFGLVALGILVTGWFAWRAWISPVAELGQADLYLLIGAVGAFISIRAIEGNEVAERILVWGIALLLLANVIAVGRQVIDPTFSPIFRLRASVFPSGYYAHYNEAANFLIASSLLLAAAALFGKHATFIRILWGIIALAGLIAVYFTRSRGGILGACIGSATFVIAALILARRKGSRWFAPVLIAIPVISIFLGAFLYSGWIQSQEMRQSLPREVAFSGVMDNYSRLYLLGNAISTISLHPFSGGGSRSFSWECFQFANRESQGYLIAYKPEQVHNELVQAATDYGLIGASLLILMIAALVIMVVVRLLFTETTLATPSANAWRVGGLAAFVGMFVQSNFSFVFHLMPGVILLGICLGQMAHSPPNQQGRAQIVGSKILLSGAAFCSMFLLLPIGWRGSQVTRILWPSYFSKEQQTESESRINALSEAVSLWPQPSLYQERAIALQSSLIGANSQEFRERASLAIQDYAKAETLHPFDPTSAINRANLLSKLEQDDEAEVAFTRAIQLQGGMEAAFKSRMSLANHFLLKGLRQFTAEDPSTTLTSLELAAQQVEKSFPEIVEISKEIKELRVSIHESLGAAREASGDYQGAMEAYNFTVSLPYGSRAHYRAGVLNGKLAALAWKERRSGEALGYFMEAKNRIAQTSELPQGVTPSQKIEYLAYLDQTIAFLKGAKIEPIQKNSASPSR
jgi:O-antigen ligase/tetratricopeptide (TPR) repeat protein